MQITGHRDEKCSFDDGALYVVYYRELFDNGTYRNHLVMRHAFTLDQAERNFIEECEQKGMDVQIYRIFQAYENRRYFYEEA